MVAIKVEHIRGVGDQTRRAHLRANPKKERGCRNLTDSNINNQCNIYKQYDLTYTWESDNEPRTVAFMAPAFLLWSKSERFSRDKYTKRGRGSPFTSLVSPSGCKKTWARSGAWVDFGKQNEKYVGTRVDNDVCDDTIIDNKMRHYLTSFNS